MSNSPPRRLRLGILVPSSNTKLEPAITSILHTINTISASTPQPVYITAHFSRLRVTQISLTSDATSQFDLSIMLSAVSLLVDADVHAIAWGGTSAGWLGVDTDRSLCAAIKGRFGVPATTATLALLAFMALLPRSERKIGLVTPYIPEMNDAIRTNLAGEGVEVVGDRGLSITDNQVIGEVTMGTLEGLLDKVMSENPEIKVVTVFCTNLATVGGEQRSEGKSESVARSWEEKYADAGRDITVLDSVALTIWGLLKKCGVDVKGLDVDEDLGKMFAM